MAGNVTWEEFIVKYKTLQSLTDMDIWGLLKDPKIPDRVYRLLYDELLRRRGFYA